MLGGGVEQEIPGLQRNGENDDPGQPRPSPKHGATVAGFAPGSQIDKPPLLV